MDYQKEYKYWCEADVFDEETHREVRSLDNEEEIKDRFSQSLSFGTGGLRGIIGAGTNRMNIYTVGKVTQGLADFINSRTTAGAGSAVIAYDSRNMSYEFALDSALILCANGIKTYLFDGLRPTPELSFAVRYLGCTAGIVVTASHNPPAYNGYKVYWSDGGQVVAPYDKQIMEKVNAVDGFESVKRTDVPAAKESGLLCVIGKEVDDAYETAVMKNVLNPVVLRENAQDIKIVYSPLHGTGNIPVRRALKELGFTQIWVVPEQELPDCNFSTVELPNPEDPKAFHLALRLARKKDADVVFVTDPDADRLGLYAKDVQTGEYVAFTGNMSGLLIAEYRLSQMREKGVLPRPTSDGALVTSIVSSDMAGAIAAEYGLTHIEVLTGFKYIGEQMELFERAKRANGGKTDGSKYAYEYLFGFEESYGSLVGTHARDKDAVAAIAALCEAAAYYKTQGLTLCDKMRQMYEKYGCYRESQVSLALRGADGAERMDTIMRRLRETPPVSVGGLQTLAVRDYQSGIRREMAEDKRREITLPRSNVLYYELESEGWCCVRPSGTELKIKFYFGVKAETVQAADEWLERMREDFLGAVADLTDTSEGEESEEERIEEEGTA